MRHEGETGGRRVGGGRHSPWLDDKVLANSQVVADAADTKESAWSDFAVFFRVRSRRPILVWRMCCARVPRL